MSDIANLRLESHYIHPKKSTWRANSKSNPETNISTKEEDNITPVIKGRVDMVVSSNFNNKNGISQAVEEPSPSLNHVSQDAPLDFSVKTVINSELDHVSDLDTSHSEVSAPRDCNMPKQDYEMHSNFTNTISTPVSAHSGKVSSSTVPIYNGSSKCQRPKQRHLNGSSSSNVNSESLGAHLKLQNACGIRLPMQDSYMMHSNSVQQAHFPISNKRLREESLNQEEETSFERNGLNSPRQSPKMSRESSPDNNQYKGSILQKVLAGIPSEVSQAHGHSSYIQNMNPSANSTQPSSLSPPFMERNSTVSPPNLMMPDTSSMLPTASTLMPGSNPLIPAAGYSLFNGLGFPSTAINGMSAFYNGSMLPPSLDTIMLQTPNPGDKKPGKHIRPFKAMTNDLLYGMTSMRHPGMSAVISNGGYFRDYTPASTKHNIDPTKSSPVTRRESSESLVNSAINTSPPFFNNGTDQKLDAAGSGDSNCSYPAAPGSIEKAESTSNRKSNRTLPDEQKDEAYWERRRKNNQAAKRSRDSRRMKEDAVAQQAWMFREQNIQLQYQNTVLEEQKQHLQKQIQHLQIQLMQSDKKLTFELQNRLEKACRKCGSRNESDMSENNYGKLNKNNGHCP